MYLTNYNKMAQEHHSIMRDKGFWDRQDVTLKEKLKLVIKEIYEAAEEVRAGNPPIYYIVPPSTADFAACAGLSSGLISSIRPWSKAALINVCAALREASTN